MRITEDWQGCTLAAPGGLWCLTFALGQLEKSDAGHPRFYKFRAVSSLQFFLQHSLDNRGTGVRGVRGNGRMGDSNMGH